MQSCPRPYEVTFRSGAGAGARLAQEIGAQRSPLLLVDKKIFELYLAAEGSIHDVPRFMVDACEEAKSIDTVLDIIGFMEQCGATKASMLYVIGGGILQDLGAFAGYMYKRGVPWTFVPTTLLAQSDSSVGGKTALNHKSTKNLLALFSAPRKIITDAEFLRTLPSTDWLSGAGEMFRLCITGGPDFLEVFADELPAFLAQDMGAVSRMTATALSAKKAVVEFDEFELDARRAMNYGHSFGHALEALTGYAIPHGVGVTLGILVENEISYRRGLLSKVERDRLVSLGVQIVPSQALVTFSSTDLHGVMELLGRDKKTEGRVLKLATIESIGQIRFIDLQLDAAGERELVAAVEGVRSRLRNG